MSIGTSTSLRILLSAYACEPDKGSEPGVGWNWALALARRGHRVWVLTRSNNRESIESACAHLAPAIRARMHFLYYDLPKWASWWKKGGRGVHQYYGLWQRGVVSCAMEAHRQHHFDVVHHLTFGVWRQPSFLYKLGIPMIFGPVGGGERAPWYLVRTLPLLAQVAEVLRYGVNWVSLINPSLRACFRNSQYVFAKTPETAEWIERAACRSAVSLEIGVAMQNEWVKPAQDGPLKCLYAGRLIGWKGVHLAISAVAAARQHNADVRLTVVGRGPMQEKLKALADSLGISDDVSFIDWLTQPELNALYQSHDMLVFPSIHDSSGNVVLEALSRALPVMCLDLGGPAVLVNNTCGVVMKTAGKTVRELENAMGATLAELAQGRAQLAKLSVGALARAKAHSWDVSVENVYSRALLQNWGARNEIFLAGQQNL